MQTKRIEYIDALRGFTMILVVFAHVETYVLSIEPNSTFISELFLSFRMPLFFFISGFISFKKNTVWDSTYLFKNLFKKAKIQIIPTLFFGLLFTYLFSIGNVSNFIHNYYKFGYWFTISLLGMFIIQYVCNFLVFSCFKKNTEKIQIYTLLFVTSILVFFKFIYDKQPIVANISDIFCFHQVCVYFPFFVFGYIVSHDKDKFHTFLDQRFKQLCIIILFIITFYFKRTSPTSFYEVHSIFILYRNFQEIIIGLLGILIVYNFFRKTAAFSEKTSISLILQKIGRRTLDIYMIHYFFLSYIPHIGNFITKSNNVVLELLFVTFLSIIVIICCLLISNILRMSKNLSSLLFGAKISA